MNVKFYLTKPKRRESPIRARFWYNNVPFEYNEKLSVDTFFWKKKQQRAKDTKAYPEAFDLNATLDDISSKIKSCYRRFLNENARFPTHQELKEMIQKQRGVFKEPAPPKKIEFFDFIDIFIKDIDDGKHVNPLTGRRVSETTGRAYKQTRQLLQEFCKRRKRTLTFSSIDTEFHRDFVYFLSSEYKSDYTGEYYSPNSVAKHITNIKSFMSYAVDRDFTKETGHTKKAFRAIREEVDSIFLDKNEIQALEDLPLDYKSREDSIRDLYIIGCNTGLRISDLKRLSPDHIKNVNGEKYIEIEMHKTSKPVSIPINDKLKKLFEKYATPTGEYFPNIYDQDVNDEIKEIGKKVEILNRNVLVNSTENGVRVSKNVPKWQLLTNHTVRRSFATNKVLEGYPYAGIMLITGHKTEKAFLKYVKLKGYHAVQLFKKQRVEMAISA